MDQINCGNFQACERAREEVQRQACGVHCPEEDPAQAHQEGQQAQAEASQVNEYRAIALLNYSDLNKKEHLGQKLTIQHRSQVPHPDGRPHSYPG